jgi:hypothetical protein
MSFTGYLLLYCVLIIAASLLGGLAPMAIRFTHRRMQASASPLRHLSGASQGRLGRVRARHAGAGAVTNGRLSGGLLQILNDGFQEARCLPPGHGPVIEGQ